MTDHRTQPGAPFARSGYYPESVEKLNSQRAFGAKKFLDRNATHAAACARAMAKRRFCRSSLSASAPLLLRFFCASCASDRASLHHRCSRPGRDFNDLEMFTHESDRATRRVQLFSAPAARDQRAFFKIE
jgi:hypothetical protein